MNPEVLYNIAIHSNYSNIIRMESAGVGNTRHYFWSWREYNGYLSTSSKLRLVNLFPNKYVAVVF
jgi:hypothetical protein